MKKLLLILTILFSAVFVAKAQDTGKIWVGGSVGITGKTTEIGLEGANFKSSALNFKIMPEFGYVLSSRMAIGIKLGYGQSEFGLEDSDALKVKTFGVNPFVRCSLLKGDIGGLFVDTGIGYAHIKYNYNSSTPDVKANALEIGFRPGVSLNISKKIALTAQFGFLGYQYVDMDRAKEHTYGLNLDLDQALFGVNFVF